MHRIIYLKQEVKFVIIIYKMKLMSCYVNGTFDC